MGTITGPRESEASGTPNQILGVTEAKTFFVRFTDGEGKIRMKGLFQIGTAADGQPGVLEFASAAEVDKTLTVPKPAFVEAVREALANPSTPTAVPTPAEFNTSDLGEEE